MRVGRHQMCGLGKLLLLGLLCANAGCDRDDEVGAAKPVVVVSVLPQAYFVERLVGDGAEVEVMLPPGASPATHEPSMGQMRVVSRAALYWKLGHPHFPFEATWLDRLVAQNDGLTVVSMIPAGGGSDSDPHLWTSPRAVRPTIAPLAEGLAGLLPQQRADIEARRDTLLSDIDALDAELRALLGPLAGRHFYVVHPAWGYLARDYGLTQVAIDEHGREPDPRTLARVIDAARRDGARTLFVQPHFSDAGAKLVAKEIGASIRSLDPLARDWAHNLRQVARVLSETLAVEARDG